MPRIFKSLFFQVVIALAAGIALGVAYPDIALQMKPLGDGFIKLIKMLVPVIVFCVVVHGISAAGDLTKVGRVGIRSLLYFEIVTTIALVFGIALAYYFQPGAGMNIDPRTLDAKALSGFSQTAAQVSGGGVSEFLMKLIPTTLVGAFSSGDVLQVLIVSIMFGCAVSLCGERAKPVVDFVERVNEIIFKMMNFVVRLAPIGVFGAIAFTVGKYGIGSLKQLGGLVALFYLAVVLFVVVVLGAIMRLSGFSLFKLLAYLREELLIVLGTAAGDSVLPQTMRKLELLGIKRSTVGLVIPTGYSFNLDAFSIYLTLAAVFIAQATNTPLATGDLLAILGVALLTSKGAHGVPGSAIVVLAATLAAIPAIPAIGLVLILSVDWFIGIARALGNYVGNCVATVVVASWEGDLDHAKAHRILNGEVDPSGEDLRADPVGAEASVAGLQTL
ncbi:MULTISPECIES: C4-dicarboxylate transporter DctA [unclassified Bradyrhizobium]|uniref:C4-dicarboxylate transporter DctA n=1 Tax=unclassified Bradyrhizobium TaxID=2631580 RepID=UPI001FF0E126|nr:MULTISPECIES: C4-dicarboxylate transporter DctA [unclassified Bradyrhizobium]MCJ9699604.1 C4-dicarboxylate transporter DctA [Bradyrhizobium sp. SHOUNA76]MCJ9729856.1 C4-dicarboxylate transporter DctA [Bradyrhizobium sp. PRIMUS42]